jgi:hypothetical protein
MWPNILYRESLQTPICKFQWLKCGTYLESNLIKSATENSWFKRKILDKAVKRIVKEKLSDDET